MGKSVKFYQGETYRLSSNSFQYSLNTENLADGDKELLDSGA